jgi:hypothetical protein
MTPGEMTAAIVAAPAARKNAEAREAYSAKEKLLPESADPVREPRE